MKESRSIYRFELIFDTYLSIENGESFKLVATDEGLFMECSIGMDVIRKPFNGEVTWFCEHLDHYAPAINNKQFNRIDILDGSEWSLKAETDNQMISCGGINYYPPEITIIFEILHRHFGIPHTEMKQTFIDMYLSSEEAKELVRVYSDEDEEWEEET